MEAVNVSGSKDNSVIPLLKCNIINGKKNKVQNLLKFHKNRILAFPLIH